MLHPGANIIDVKTAGVTITGFAITGTSAAGILVNGSPDIIDIVGKPLVIYNNIYGNDIGLQNDLTEENADAAMNFWGTNGNGAEKGKPGAATGTHANNDVEPESGVNYDPRLTAKVVNADHRCQHAARLRSNEYAVSRQHRCWGGRHINWRTCAHRLSYDDSCICSLQWFTLRIFYNSWNGRKIY